MNQLDEQRIREIVRDELKKEVAASKTTTVKISPIRTKAVLTQQDVKKMMEIALSPSPVPVIATNHDNH